MYILGRPPAMLKTRPPTAMMSSDNSWLSTWVEHMLDDIHVTLGTTDSPGYTF